MALTAKSRACLKLEAATALTSNDDLEGVKQTTGEVRGGGANLLTSGIQNLGAQVHVERKSEPTDASVGCFTGRVGVGRGRRVRASRVR